MKKIILLAIVLVVLAAWIVVLMGFQESQRDKPNPPTASFTYTITSPDTGGPVSFVDGSTDPDGDIAGYSWDFGDGTTSTEQNPTHQYLSGGTYTVTLTVTDSKNHTGFYSATIGVLSKGRPDAFFVYSPVSPTVNDVIQFTDLSTDPDGTIVSWYWEFGDDNISTEQNPAHQYSTWGYTTVIFTVKLTVTDDDGNTDSYQTGIDVGPGG